MPHYTEVDTLLTTSGTTIDVATVGTGGGTPGSLDGGSAESTYGTTFDEGNANG